MEMKKILVFGAGVLGSLYAARMHEAGLDVTLVARGQRYQDLKEHGVVLEEFASRQRTVTRVKVVDEMPRREAFDVCLVFVQRTQVEGALPTLAANPNIPSFVFMHNMTTGPEELCDALGRERVVIGHANAGGEREGHVVVYMITQNVTLGELDGSTSDRLKAITQAFRVAGFGVEWTRNIDSWKRYHVALVTPLTYAMVAHEVCNYRLAESRHSVKLYVQGMRECFKALQVLGFPVEPSKLGMLMWMPDFLLVPLFRKILGSKIMDIGGARHLRNALDEMEELARELDVLIDESGVKTPALDQLKRESGYNSSGVRDCA